MSTRDAVTLRKQAKDCLEQANKAGNPADEEAWLLLADDLIKLAIALEQESRLRDH